MPCSPSLHVFVVVLDIPHEACVCVCCGVMHLYRRVLPPTSLLRCAITIVQDLLTIFLRWGFPSPSGTQYIFNGDFVDRGQHSIETLTLLLAYRLLYPGSVHLNRGNHETASICMKYGLQDEVLSCGQGIERRLCLCGWEGTPSPSPEMALKQTSAG